MELKDIAHLPDDVLNIIFLYMTNPLTDALKRKQKAIHFLEDDEEQDGRQTYVLYKSVYQVREVKTKGFIDDLYDNIPLQVYFKQKYNHYEFDDYGKLIHHNEPERWITRLQRLKLRTSKDLKQIITNNKIPNRSYAKTKKQMIQLIIKYE